MGSAYDPQEGAINDNNRLIWTSDRAGELGRGPTVFTPVLEEGEHVITLTTVSSAGQTGSESITVHITAPDGEPTRIGDVNGDGQVNVADALMILQHITGLLELNTHQQTAANVSGCSEGTVSVTDAILILRYVVGLISDFGN